MEIRLEHDPDGTATVAARLAVAQAGVEPAIDSVPSLWWHAGLADAVERAPELRAAEGRYDTALSPRSTRGATRA